MIEAATLQGSAQPGQAKSSPLDETLLAGGFSFSLALQSLEARAAQSLETHGAAPTTPAVTARKDSNVKPTSPDQTQHSQSPERANAQSKAAGQSTSIEARASEPIATRMPSSEAPSTTFVSPVSTAPSPQTTVATQVQTSRVDAAALRANGATKTTPPKQAMAPTPKPATPATTEFAQILARRLGNESTFDVRLDPPELGRVEARLKLGDGEQALLLKFENQSGLDLFQQDDAALRSMLSSFGFEMADGRIDYSLMPSAPEDARHVAQTDDAAPLPLSHSLSPAPFSAGVIDIKV